MAVRPANTHSRIVQSAAGVQIHVSDTLADVAGAWRRLEAAGIESPGQSLDFAKSWVKAFAITPEARRFVVIERDGAPLAVFGLEVKRRWGLRVLEPFGGMHVGSNAPLLDQAGFAALSHAERAAIWQDTVATLGGDLLIFANVFSEQVPLFGGVGVARESETLYRTQFDSWEACDAEQRTRSRRKHDKQQGAKLAAMGEVSFEEIDAGEDVSGVLTVLFEDRAARFAEQGIADPFAPDAVRAFYRDVFSGGEQIKGKLHVLRLDGRIVATRYNLVHGEKMFCLISSMAIDPALAPGSPGKQILLRIMQTIFAQGFRVFDLGAGFSDEKRHWCNVQIPLSTVCVPASMRGTVMAAVLGQTASLKARIKSNKTLFKAFKSLRAKIGGRD